VDDIVPADFESDDLSAAMVCHQDRVNRWDGIKLSNRHIRTMALRGARRQGKPCPKAAIDCNTLPLTVE
jgi:hypothetical protein